MSDKKYKWVKKGQSEQPPKRPIPPKAKEGKIKDFGKRPAPDYKGIKKEKKKEGKNG